MARAQGTDFLSSMRFRVVCVNNAQRLNPTQTGPYGSPPAEAGFQDVQVPDLSVGEVAYKEGTWVYSKKYPGMPTVGNITMSRGVTKSDGTFLAWMRQAAEGGEYREDLKIEHYHRDSTLAVGTNTAQLNGNSNLTYISTQAKPAKTYNLFEAFPVSHKVGSDLASTAAEISIMNLTVAYEYFTVDYEENTGATAAG